MKEKLELFIQKNLETNYSFQPCFSKAKYFSNEECMGDYASIEQFVHQNKNEHKFQTLLFQYIDDRGFKDSDVYNKVHIDRRLFSKIRNDEEYHPSKETVILLALALELNIDDANRLLESASYSLPKNNYYDLIIRFCFMEGIYQLSDVNDLLAMYSCNLLHY